MEGVKIVPGLSQQAGNVAAAADRVSLENYERVAILVTIYQAAADANTLTFHKATAASAGTEDTTNAIPNWWYCEDVTLGTTADTWTKGTAVVSGATIATSAVGGNTTSYYLIDIGADELPEGGYDYKFVELNTGAVSDATNLVNAVYLLYNPRYAQAVLPSGQA
jgi:hypothetical protein